MLGSLPGDASLAAGQYYGHPRNRFWDLIGAVIEQPGLAAHPYPRRLEILHDAGIGLWDTITSAERSGSLDSAIRNSAAAPLVELVRTLPALQAVAFNGGKSAATGRKALAGTHLVMIDLPSSSPAHAAMPFAEKLEHWQALKHFLD